MSIEITNAEQMTMLGKAVRFSYERSEEARMNRDNLIRIFMDKGFDNISSADLYDATGRESDDTETLVNLFQDFVKGHLISLAFHLPRWDVTAQITEGIGFDMRARMFLERYSELLDLGSVFKACAQDSAFGRAICKIVSSVAPKGVYSAVAPRAYRISPNCFYSDRSSSRIDECSFLADEYMLPLNEAREHFKDSASVEYIKEYTPESSNQNTTSNDDISDRDAYPETMTRLIDIFIRSAGVIVTYPLPNDSFSLIGQIEPLQVIKTPIVPYEVVDLMTAPDTVEEVARLSALRGLHLMTNENWFKARKQSQRSKGVPIAKVGMEDDARTVETTEDREFAFLNELGAESLNFYNIPGADPSVVQMAQLASATFSRQAGNLEVALGHSPGADTARQTQAIISQVSAAQAVDRDAFEQFQSNIGSKLLALAFEDEQLTIETNLRVPGTTFVVNIGWAPADRLPRPGTVADYIVKVTPYSGAFRSPQERIAHIQQASQILVQWMMAKAQGIPANLQAITRDLEHAFDVAGKVTEWFSDEPPTPQQQATDTYTSMAQPAQGSQVNYNSSSPQSGGGSAAPAAEALQAGFTR